MKSREAALSLVVAAFRQAQKKWKIGGSSMSVAVLNNRLLQLTDRKFDPKDFGAQDLRALLATLAPEIRVLHDEQGFKIELADVAQLGTIGSLDRRREGSQGSATNLTTEMLAGSGRIRPDLWLSIVDYASGRTYVWDEQQGKARPAIANDLQRPLPTLTPAELTEWRQSFIDAYKSSLEGADLANALRWQEQGLPTLHLPANLQQRWNKDLTRRVRQRLHAFFSLKKSIVIPSVHAPTNDEAKSPLQVMDEEIAAARDRGDNFSVGELLARGLQLHAGISIDTVLARMICAWSSSKGPLISPESLADMSAIIEGLAPLNVAAALINSLRRLNLGPDGIPEGIRDLSFRLRVELKEIFSLEERRSPIDLCRTALAALDSRVSEMEEAVARFLRTTPATAKPVSIEILRVANRLLPMLAPAERQYLRDIEVLIGPAFRKLCEAYERNDDADVIRRAPEFLDNLKTNSPSTGDPRLRSVVWLTLVQPIVDHLASIVEEATSRGEVSLAPVLGLRNPKTKADLKRTNRQLFLSFSLRNVGRGHAYDVSLEGNEYAPGVALMLVEPTGPFDVPAGSEQLVRMCVDIDSSGRDLEVPIRWTCQTAVGREATFNEKLFISQQVTEPNWDALLANPPYSLNPVKIPERLYGRESSLRRLRLAAMAGASTFVWGQKRIGKTSLLQVLDAELAQRPDTTCVLFRMGELVALHEGQLATLVARRLVEKSGFKVPIPGEAEFGAGIGRLIPFADSLLGSQPGHKFIVIIDEFDDLDPSFYMGERGKQFVKALRSVSEIGITFFFVGSERMAAIYDRHNADLNKWTNVELDRIDSRTDCRTLIETPVSGVIEFSPEAIDFIIDYTNGNPFYIHNFCYQMFDRCFQEHRTFVDDNDTQAVRQQLLRALGSTNFAHFWEDNPLLDPLEKQRASAENCVALTCIAVLGGRFESVEDLQEVQESLPLQPGDRASGADLRRACERLVNRKVLSSRATDSGYVIGLQIFREWLGENAVAKLLPTWTEFKADDRHRQEGATLSQPTVAPDTGVFPIAEDDMLAVAQKLVYCGRQKDVAEIRSWLRQFDDDGRIEIAFMLLKRLSERGFINEGMKARALQKLTDMINSRRLEIGGKTWRIVKGRCDNLAIGYVDSEHKSGAVTARELQKSIRPGKCSPAIDLGTWMRSHLEDDAIVAIVDDFAGTGDTVTKGVKQFRDKIDNEVWKRYADSGRISLYLMFAFPEAIERAKRIFPKIDVVAANTLGDELRACDDNAELFESDGEQLFAREFLLQIGRDLYPSAPLGYGDLGALVMFYNSAPNNTLPIFWNNGLVGEQVWKPLFPRA
jgi:hypothetical protein